MFSRHENQTCALVDSGRLLPSVERQALSRSPLCAEGQSLTVSPLWAEGQSLTMSPLCAEGQSLTMSPLCAEGQSLTMSPLCTEGQSLRMSPLCTEGQTLTMSPLCTEGQSLTMSPLCTEGQHCSVKKHYLFVTKHSHPQCTEGAGSRGLALTLEHAPSARTDIGIWNRMRPTAPCVESTNKVSLRRSTDKGHNNRALNRLR